MQVEAGSLFPGDWDESNNRSHVVRVEATSGPTRFNYWASASVTRNRSISSSKTSWSSPAWGVAGEWGDEWRSESDMESAQMNGWIDRGVSGTILVEVSQTSGGSTVNADSWTEEVNNDFFCGVRYGQGATLLLCSYTYGTWSWTNFIYSRSAGTVTYHSSGYSRSWDHITGEDIFYYHHNYESSYTTGPLAGVRDDYSFRVRLTAGDVVLTAASDFALTFGENAWTNSSCYDYQSSWDNYTSRTCLSSDYKSTEWYGSDSCQAGW